MHVTVLLTSFNRPAMLRRAVESVMTQTYRDWDLVVLDDGSADQRAIGWIVPYLTGTPGSRLVCFRPTEEERRASVRYAELINWGAAHSEGEALTFLTDDDWFLPTRLERMVARLSAADRPPVVYGAQRLWDLDGGVRLPHDPPLRRTNGVLADAFHRVDHNSVMVRRDAFEEVGGFPTDPSLWRDADAHFWRRLTAAGHLFHPVDDTQEPTDAHLFHDDTVDMRVRHGLDPWQDVTTESRGRFEEMTRHAGSSLLPALPIPLPAEEQ